MKNFFYSIFFILLFLFSIAIFYLSTAGFETSKFNNLIIKEIKKKDAKIDLNLEKIKIKFDIKKIQLFLSTNKPKITYQNIEIPITEIKVYSKINKILSSKIEISQIIFRVEKFKIKDVQDLAIRIKPSNFKTYLLNNLNSGEIEEAIFELNVDKNFNLIGYKAKGKIKKVDAKIINNFTIKNISFNFIFDSQLTLINSINANFEGILVSNGSISLKRNKAIQIKGMFDTQFDLKENQLKKFIKNNKFFNENEIKIQGSLTHEFEIKINNNFKIMDYDYKSRGNILESKINLKKSFKNDALKKEIKKILFNKANVELNFNTKNKNSLLLDGLYTTDELTYKKFKIKYNLDKKNQNYLIDFNIAKNITFDLINLKIPSNKVSNIKSEFNIRNNKLIFKSINFTEEKNSIFIKGLELNKNYEISKLSSVRVLTFDGNKENNNFLINFGKKIIISGKKYDSTNLLEFMSKDSKSNLLTNISKEVEIQIKNLISESKIPLRNFNLIGMLEKGKFNKMSAKGEFVEDKYLDISLKTNLNKKKIIEIYSDLPQVLLSNYKFFEGIRDGKLLYHSTVDEKGSVSRLTIENFKVIKAPAFATLLALADLGGVTDLLSGKGMSFDLLEVIFEDKNNVTTVKDILALGPSLSLHMEGYIQKKPNLVSLSGTLVPAKMLNSLVSKIPVVGNILVGKKVGEGIFGVSFKMKGPPEKIKTTVNPIKTLTPRFITRALEKRKKK
jgi:hypothetical protein